MQGVNIPYDVTVLRCADTMLQLGYTSLDWLANKEAPCGGRDLQSDCYLIRVSLRQNAAAPSAQWPWALLLLPLLLAPLFVRYYQLRRRNGTPPPVAEGDWVALGAARFSLQLMLLEHGSDSRKLTYREAKLLAFFAAHPNELLARERILEAVWGEEGLMVGRSVDVFVSRLRKYLRGAQVEITAVHGVGYRLDVG